MSADLRTKKEATAAVVVTLGDRDILFIGHDDELYIGNVVTGYISMGKASKSKLKAIREAADSLLCHGV